MENKYELTDETIEYLGHILHRIKALKDFGDIKKGDLGGYIESERNLSYEGDCWVGGNAKVFDNAWIYNNAMVFHNAQVFGFACVYDYAMIKDNAEIWGHACIINDASVVDNAKIYNYAIIKECSVVGDYAKISNDAIIKSNDDYMVFKNNWNSINHYFTWTKSNNMWLDDDFYGNGKNLIKNAHNFDKNNWKKYKLIVKLVKKLNK